MIHRRVYTKIEGPSLTPFIKQLKAIVRRVFVNRCQVGVLRCAPGQCFEDQLYSNGTLHRFNPLSSNPSHSYLRSDEP